MASGKPTKSVPWSDVAKNQTAFLSADVVPEDYVMQDPSRLKLQQAQELIRFWKSTQFSFEGVLEGENIVEAEAQVPVSKARRRKNTTTARTTSKRTTKGQVNKSQRPARSGGAKGVQIAKKGKGKSRALPPSSDDESGQDEPSDPDTEDVEFGDSSEAESGSDTSGDLSESGSEEDFSTAVNKIVDNDVGPSSKRSQKPPAKGSPASITKGNRKAFLLSLCARTEYQELIEAIYSDEVIFFTTINYKFAGVDLRGHRRTRPILRCQKGCRATANGPTIRQTCLPTRIISQMQSLPSNGWTIFPIWIKTDSMLVAQPAKRSLSLSDFRFETYGVCTLAEWMWMEMTIPTSQDL